MGEGLLQLRAVLHNSRCEIREVSLSKKCEWQSAQLLRQRDPSPCTLSKDSGVGAIVLQAIDDVHHDHQPQSKENVKGETVWLSSFRRIEILGEEVEEVADRDHKPDILQGGEKDSPLEITGSLLGEDKALL